VTVDQSCAICERTLLMGERATRFSPNGGADYVDVCPLCAETAVEYGWIREGAPTSPTVPTERRRKGRRGIMATIMGTRPRQIEETIAPDPILRRLSPQELAIVEAADLFNASQYRRTVSGIAKYLARRGPSLHHLGYAVDDVAEDARLLREKGLQQIDLGGLATAAFFYPKSAMGILTELVPNRRTRQDVIR